MSLDKYLKYERNKFISDPLMIDELVIPGSREHFSMVKDNATDC